MRPCIDSLERSLPLIEGAGWTHGLVQEIGNVYISGARANLVRKAMNGGADVIVFIDYDLSWSPQSLLKLIETKADVAAGCYRFKKDEIEYMGLYTPHPTGVPQVRGDGCVVAHAVPAGFLKITSWAVDRFMEQYPELCYGDRYAPYVDMFNHGAIERRWFGEDYAFSKRWVDKCGELWIVPDLDITHHTTEKAYPGNFHQYLISRKAVESQHVEKENAVTRESAHRHAGIQQRFAPIHPRARPDML